MSRPSARRNLRVPEFLRLNNTSAPPKSEWHAARERTTTLPPAGVANRRLVSESEALKRTPVAGCEAVPHFDDVKTWTAVIEGPPSTPYEGGTFFAELAFSEHTHGRRGARNQLSRHHHACRRQLPVRAAQGTATRAARARARARECETRGHLQVLFKTRIYHCNIDALGCVKMDLTSCAGWNSCATTADVLRALVALLVTPKRSAWLVRAAAEQLAHDADAYEATARLWTQRYAC